METKAGLIVFKKLLKLLDELNSSFAPSTISQCSYITPDVLDEYDNAREGGDEDCNWDTTSFWEYISDNEKKVNIETIKKYRNKPWNWNFLSRNPNITIEIISEYSDMPWELLHFMHNPNFRIDLIYSSSNMTEYFEENCDRKLLKSFSKNPYLTIELIDKYEEDEWDWKEISKNKNINVEIIGENPNMPWDWIELSWHNPNISMESINKFPDLPWDWCGISRHENITMQDIENN